MILVSLAICLQPHDAEAAAIPAVPPKAASPAPAAPMLAENPLSEPPSNAGKPIEVAVGLRVLNLSDVDEVAERFHLSGYLFLRWSDPRLRHQPDDHQVYKVGQFWIPQVETINGIDPREVHQVSLTVEPEGTVNYVERFSATVSSRFALRRFPFDHQTLLFILMPFVSDSRFVTFVPDPRRTGTTHDLELYSSLASWDIKEIRTEINQVTTARGMKISETRFEVNVRRRYAFYIWKIFLPLMLMVGLSWTVFWVEPTSLTDQIQIAVTTILTIIAFAFAVSANLPRVPYLTYIDAFFLCCYVFVFLAMLEVMVVHVAHRNELAHRGLAIRRRSRYLVPAAFLTTNVVIAVHFLRR